MPPRIERRSAPRRGGFASSTLARSIRAAVLLLALPGTVSGQDVPDPVQLSDGCRFAAASTVMVLQGDCTTDVSIEIPDGVTLDGNHHVIIAIDSSGRAFRGAVVIARGRSASIVDTTITALLEDDECRTGPDRLRAIYFEGASGIIRDNIVDHVVRPRATCEEGNAIEVWNGRQGPGTTVEVTGNRLARYQKSGIVVHGRVDAYIYSNEIARSATPRVMASNGVQIGPEARATLRDNTIASTAYGGRDASGSAVLLIETAPGTLVSGNTIAGDGDVGIHVLADQVIVEDNRVTDSGPDGVYDIGIVNLGEGNLFSNNTIRGYRTPYYGVSEGSTGRRRQIE